MSITTNKILFLGAENVGKTSLRDRYIEVVDPETGRNYSVGRKLLADSTWLEGWDITDYGSFVQDLGAQKRFYTNPLVALLIFDITEPETFNVIPEWITNCLENNNNELIPLALVGNKSDRRDDSSVGYAEAINYAELISKWALIKVPYFEISARYPESYDKLDSFIENLEFYTTFFHSFKAQERDQIFLADRLYSLVKKMKMSDIDYAEYLSYLRANETTIRQNFGID